MTGKHLYEFEEGGFYAAESRDEALRLYDADCGDACAATDFKRAVPDDELVDVHQEDPGDKWDDPREYPRALTIKGEPSTNPLHVRWFLKVTAREWANELTHGRGYVFGGEHY